MNYYSSGESIEEEEANEDELSSFKNKETISNSLTN
jgi:hypothetical protein